MNMKKITEFKDIALKRQHEICLKIQKENR
jgi:hypothetical protein